MKLENFRSEPSKTPDSPDSSINLPALPTQRPNASNSKLRRNSISLPALTSIDSEALQNLNEILTIDVSFYCNRLSKFVFANDL